MWQQPQIFCCDRMERGRILSKQAALPVFKYICRNNQTSLEEPSRNQHMDGPAIHVFPAIHVQYLAEQSIITFDNSIRGILLPPKASWPRPGTEPSLRVDLKLLQTADESSRRRSRHRKASPSSWHQRCARDARGACTSSLQRA